MNEEAIVADALCTLEALILSEKDTSDPNVAEYLSRLRMVMRHRDIYSNTNTGFSLLRNRKRGASSFNCGWCKERIIGQDIQKHINACSRHSPEHPANMVKALKEIVNDC